MKLTKNASVVVLIELVGKFGHVEELSAVPQSGVAGGLGVVPMPCRGDSRRDHTPQRYIHDIILQDIMVS